MYTFFHSSAVGMDNQTPKMDTEKTVMALNTLIITNTDRMAGYEIVISDTADGDLKVLFSEFRITAIKCKNELVNEVLLLGGIPALGTYRGGQLLRVWMDYKNSLEGNNRLVILQACKYGEELVVESYNKALRENPHNLTEVQQTRINAQRNLLIAESERIKFCLNQFSLRR